MYMYYSTELQFTLATVCNLVYTNEINTRNLSVVIATDNEAYRTLITILNMT